MENTQTQPDAYLARLSEAMTTTANQEEANYYAYLADAVAEKMATDAHRAQEAAAQRAMDSCEGRKGEFAARIARLTEMAQNLVDGLPSLAAVMNGLSVEDEAKIDVAEMAEALEDVECALNHAEDQCSSVEFLLQVTSYMQGDAK